MPDRNFNLEEPNRAWVSDITYVRTNAVSESSFARLEGVWQTLGSSNHYRDLRISAFSEWSKAVA